MYLSGLIGKEFQRIRADKRTLVLIFLIPVVLIIIFGLTSGGGPTKTFTTVVITRDSMPWENSNSTLNYDEVFISVIEDECSQWDLYKDYHSESEEQYENAYDECMELLKAEVIDCFLVLREDFSETVENGTNTVLTYHIDASDKEAVDAFKVAIKEPIALFKIKVEKTTNFVFFQPMLEWEVPFWETQVLNYALALVLSMLIVGLLMNLTALSIVSEGPLPRMMLTPTAKNEIILSKLIANSIVMIVQVTIIFAMSAIFGLYSLGSLFDLYIILLATGMCGICMGLFISAFAKTEQVANQLYIMFFVCIMMFSGAFIKLEKLPLTMQIIVNSLPLSHSVPLIIGVTKKGLPIDLGHMLSLNLISLVFLVMAYVVFRLKKIEV